MEIKRLNRHIFNYTFSLLKSHKKDTKGKRLLKKKLKNKSPLLLWGTLMACGLTYEVKKLSISMPGRGSYPPGGIFFHKEMDYLLTPRPIEASEVWIPKPPVNTFYPSNEFSKELIVFLDKQRDTINRFGNHYYNKDTGLKEGVAWLDDETPDMADAFAYCLENKLNPTKYELPQYFIDFAKKRKDQKF